MSFYHIRASERAKYASILHCTILVDRFFAEGGRSESKMKLNTSGVSVDNTRGHFAHCSHFSSPLRGSEIPRNS